YILSILRPFSLRVALPGLLSRPTPVKAGAFPTVMRSARRQFRDDDINGGATVGEDYRFFPASAPPEALLPSVTTRLFKTMVTR
ncbi:MAG TPA: hypothetical protein VG942_00755, partial [Hyphomonadaceae bacterium]|nr:hypothetical protein [Hyphomonadaceae bacterium]